MKRWKQGIAWIGAMLGLVAALSGCGEKAPTPEELFQNAFPEGKELSADLSLALEAEMDMGGLFGTGGSDSGMTMSMSVSMDGHVNQQGGIVHMDGQMAASFFGMSVDEPMDEWQEQHQDGTVDKYSFDSETGTWTVSHETASVSAGSDVMGIDCSRLEGLTLKDTDKKSGLWAVTGQLPMDAMGMMQGDGFDSLGLEDGAADIPGASFLATFDRKSYEMKSMTITMDGYEADGVKVTKFLVEIKNMAFGDGTMAVPANIKEGAVEDSGFGGSGWGTDLDSGYGIEDGEPEAAWINSVDFTSEGMLGAVGALSGGAELQAFSSYDPLSGATYLYLMCLNTGNVPVAGYLGWQDGNDPDISDYAYVYVPAGRYDVADFVFYEGELPDAANLWIETFDPWEELVSDGIALTGAWNREDQMVSGSIANNSGKDIDWVKVKAVFFRGNGEIAYMASDYADPSQLSDGEEGTFQIWTGMMPQGMESEDLTVSVYVMADEAW